MRFFLLCCAGLWVALALNTTLGGCSFQASMPCSNVCEYTSQFLDCLRDMCSSGENTASTISSICEETNSQIRSLGCSCTHSCSSIVSGGCGGGGGGADNTLLIGGGIFFGSFVLCAICVGVCKGLIRANDPARARLLS